MSHELITGILISGFVLTLSACEYDESKAKMNDNDSWELSFDDTDEINKDGLEFDENFDGIKIVVSVESENGLNKINLRGIYRTFVNCGSRRAIWQGFDSHFNYYAKDTKTGKTYGTQFSPLSISHAPEPMGPDGVPIPDAYDQMPCDQFDKRYFTAELYELIDDLPRDVSQLEVFIKIYNEESNKVIVDVNH